MPRGLKPGNLVSDPGFRYASSGLRLLSFRLKLKIFLGILSP